MDCSCDFDSPQFYCVQVRKARKLHKCDECNGCIERGESYEYVSAKWDYVCVFKTCARCVDLRVWVKNNVPCLCWMHGDADNSLREAVDDAYHRARDEVVGLKFGLLRRFALRDKFNQERKAA